MGELLREKIDHTGGSAGAAACAGPGSRAHTGQMQRFPRSCAGSWAKAALDTGVCMHQQPCGSAPEAMAHRLGSPQAGQMAGDDNGARGMKTPGAARNDGGLQCITQGHEPCKIIGKIGASAYVYCADSYIFNSKRRRLNPAESAMRVPHTPAIAVAPRRTIRAHTAASA